jgi:PAS domain-containing protein
MAFISTDIHCPSAGHEIGENPFRKVFLSSHDAMLILSSTASDFLDLNPQASSIFGYTRQQLLHLPPKRTICLYKGQWESLLDSVTRKQ